MKHILYAIGWVWLLPVNILALCWLLPMKAKGNFSEITWDWNSWSWHWEVDELSKFYENSMSGWWGFVIGNNVIHVEYIINDAQDKQYMVHEETHVLQNYIFGALFYPVYIACSGYLYLFAPTKHPYLDNFFEVWARKTAGQQKYIAIPPNDRWPWW